MPHRFGTMDDLHLGYREANSHLKFRYDWAVLWVPVDVSSLTSQMDPSPQGYLEILRFYIKLVLYFFLHSAYLNMLYFLLRYRVKFKYSTVVFWQRSWMVIVSPGSPSWRGALCHSLKANSTQTISCCALGNRENFWTLLFGKEQTSYCKTGKYITSSLHSTMAEKNTHLEAFNTFLTHFSILTSDFSHQKQKEMLCFCNSIFQTSDFASQRSMCVSQF